MTTETAELTPGQIDQRHALIARFVNRIEEAMWLEIEKIQRECPGLLASNDGRPYADAEPDDDSQLEVMVDKVLVRAEGVLEGWL